VLDTIGDTPCIRVNNLAPEGVTVYVKAEAFNPGGVGQGPPRAQHHRGRRARRALKPGQTVVEATSGNTGIGLAMVCAAKGYPLVVTMAESFSVERRRLMRLLGAQGRADAQGREGLRHVQEGGSWPRNMAGSSPASSRPPPTPRSTRRPRRARSSPISTGERLDYWVSGYGTGGTVTGHRPRAAQGAPRDEDHPQRARQRPARRQRRRSRRNDAGAPADSHPAFEPHPIQGWTPDFIPWVLQEAIDKAAITTS
jgi:cysteine synthase A